jgi:hypothetical protein
MNATVIAALSSMGNTLAEMVQR